MRFMLVLGLFSLVACKSSTPASGGSCTAPTVSFLNPANGGWLSVIAYILGLSVFLLGLGALAIGYGRARFRRALIVSKP